MIHLRKLQLGRLRRGLTLVELLIVITIIVSLAAVTLPSLKTLLRDRMVDQAGNRVKAFFELAQAQAIGSGKASGVILDRVSYDAAPDGSAIVNNTCLRLTLANVYAPYTGDLVGTRCRLYDSNSDGFADVAEFLSQEVTSLISVNLIQAGDLISFGGRDNRFVITVAPYIPTNDTASTVVRVQFANPSGLVGIPTSTYATSKPLWPTEFVMPAPLTDLVAPANVPPEHRWVPFEITRKPTRSLSTSIVLPRGACIDLSLSGIGVNGTQFSSGLTAGNYGPVVVIFNPDGGVSANLYSNSILGPMTPFGGGSPLGVIHFMIGRTEQVVASPNFVDHTTGVTSDRDDFKSNLMDPANLWLSVNPWTGKISLTECGGVSTVTPPTSIPTRLIESRAFATGGIDKGGL